VKGRGIFLKLTLDFVPSAFGPSFMLIDWGIDCDPAA